MIKILINKKNGTIKLFKARSLPIGTRRTHGGVLKEKTPKGWIPVGAEKLNLSFGKFKTNLTEVRKVKTKYKKRKSGDGGEISISNKVELGVILNYTSFSCISGGRNPESKIDQKLNNSQIEKRSNQLKADLKKNGYLFTPVVGHYGDVEDSFLVMTHDADKKDMKELGKKYNQDSVLFVNKGKGEIIYTTGKNAGKTGMAGKGYEIGPKLKEYYTEVKVGSKEERFSMRLKELIKSFIRLVFK